MDSCLKKSPFLFSLLSVFLVTFTSNSHCAAVISENSVNNVTTLTVNDVENNRTEVELRADIIYNAEDFNEIEIDTFQVKGNMSLTRIKLGCQSSRNKSDKVDWETHGLLERKYAYHDENYIILDLSNGPPVLRLECKLHSNESITNNTLVYTGDGKPPYLHNHAKSIRANILNETTARIPCVLNYPLDNIDHMELQLFKDGQAVDNKNNCLSYTPEDGFLLNMTKLDNPKGKYQCKVLNSTDDDWLNVELQNDDYIQVSGEDSLFYAGDPNKHKFNCSLPKSKFNNVFHWFYLIGNETYEPIEKSLESQAITSDDADEFKQSINIKFLNETITGIVCGSFIKDSAKMVNNTFMVTVKEATKPYILGPPEDKIYGKNLHNLTCAANATPVWGWKWLKNGENFDDFDQKVEYPSNPHAFPKSSLIFPKNPSTDDLNSNYTCMVYNFLGDANHTFQVMQPPEKVDNGWLIVTTVIIAALVVSLAVVLACCRVKLERRRFSDTHIQRFFHGLLRSAETPYNELEPYASVSYDYSREIKYKSLIFDKQLKGGNFGKVHFGRLLDKDNNSSIPVAIKSIKDFCDATEKEMDQAFKSFLNEIKIMQYLGYHANIVTYVGAVTSDLANYSAYLVVEYCSKGDLDTYLKEFRKNGGSFHDDVQGLHQDLHSRNNYNSMSNNPMVLKTSHLLKWAEDIAAGMEYLTSKNLVHMDLAARNVLLGHRGINSDEYVNVEPEKLIAKISDFGLSKDLHGNSKDYYQIVFHADPECNRPRQLPLRWLSIEALENLRFTIQSDIWALGVTFWEMFSLGSVPYDGIIQCDDLRIGLISYLKGGNVLPQPEYVPQEIWDIMLQCWNENPSERPNFNNIKKSVHEINNRMKISSDNDTIIETNYQSVNVLSPYSTVGFVENMGYNDVGDINNYSNENSENDEEEEDDSNV